MHKVSSADQEQLIQLWQSAKMREVRDIILDLKTRGRTVFFSTHILSDTEMICDRVGLLMKGALKAVGTIDELVSRDVPYWEVALQGVVNGNLPCGRRQ